MVGTEPSELLLEHTQDMISVLSDDGTFEYVSPAVERVLGYDPEALVGENAFERIHEADREAVVGAFERTIGTTESSETTAEFRFRDASGEWTWVESRMSNATEPELDGYVVSSREIDERKTARRERDAIRRRLEEVAGATRDVLWMFDGGWTEVLLVNSAFEEVYGLPRERVLEDPTVFLDAVHPEDLPLVEEKMERLSAGERIDVEYRVNPDEGYERRVWVQGQPIFEGEEVARIAGFSRDVTRWRRREQQLRVIDRLLRHDLRNDLQTVVGQAELLAEEPDPDVSARTDRIRETSDRLIATAEKQRSIIDLLTGPSTASPLDLREVVDGAAGILTERYPDARVEAVFPESTCVHALPEVELCLAELLENAVEHGPRDDPTVRVVGEVEGKTVAVSIEDDCPPIPAEVRTALGGDVDRRMVDDAGGVGLWLVHWVVDLSDGDLSFARTDRPGNRVTVTLPRASTNSGDSGGTGDTDGADEREDTGHTGP